MERKLMAEYICDGSYRNDIVGAGIVKVTNETVNNFHFHTNLKEEKQEKIIAHPEIYAIYKTLELVQLYNDKQVIIYNDDKGLINVLEAKAENNSKKKAWCSILFRKINQLRERDFDIQIKYINQLKEKHYHHLAHRLSRKYLQIGNSPQQEKSTGTMTILEFLASRNIVPTFHQEREKDQKQQACKESKLIENKTKETSKTIEKKVLEEKEERHILCNKMICGKRRQYFLSYTFLSFEEVFTKNKRQLKSKYQMEEIEKNQLLISREELQNTNQFVFQTIGGKHWGIFTKEEKLLYVTKQNLIHTSLSLLNMLKEMGCEKISLNDHYFNCLRGSFTGMKGKDITDKERNQMEEQFQILVSLMKQFDITTFYDFYFH